MKMVSILTQEQKNIISDKEYSDGCFFNPVQDANGNWVVSAEEINQCEKKEFSWLKNLELTEFLIPIKDVY